MSEITATAPDGVMHVLIGDSTVCGLNASGWSRTVTVLQVMGLVVFCDQCDDLRCRG